MKFVVPNYSCLQDPWLGGCHPQITVPSVLIWICWTPPPNKIPGYATAWFYLGTTSNTLAIIRDDDTIPVMHRTLTMFFFKAGNISLARCTSTFGVLFARDCRISCNFTSSLSHIMMCWLDKKMVCKNADTISQLWNTYPNGNLIISCIQKYLQTIVSKHF